MRYAMRLFTGHLAVMCGFRVSICKTVRDTEKVNYKVVGLPLFIMKCYLRWKNTFQQHICLCSIEGITDKRNTKKI